MDVIYFSESLIEYTQDFICSVSLGYDVVPRLGILELKNLKIDILEAIKNCPLPKVTAKTKILIFFYSKDSNLSLSLDKHQVLNKFELFLVQISFDHFEVHRYLKC